MSTIHWPHHIRSEIDLHNWGLASTVFQCALCQDSTFSLIKISVDRYQVDNIPIIYYQPIHHLCIITAKLQAFHLGNQIIPDPAEDNDLEPTVQWVLGFRQTLAYHFSVSVHFIAI
jgi:hypothetical protein